MVGVGEYHKDLFSKEYGDDLFSEDHTKNPLARSTPPPSSELGVKEQRSSRHSRTSM